MRLLDKVNHVIDTLMIVNDEFDELSQSDVRAEEKRKADKAKEMNLCDEELEIMHENDLEPEDFDENTDDEDEDDYYYEDEK